MQRLSALSVSILCFCSLIISSPASASMESYTYVIDEPYVAHGMSLTEPLPFYTDLLAHIQSSDPFPVNRLLLKVAGTGTAPGATSIFDPDLPGNYGIMFLKTLSALPSKPEVYLYLDPENHYEWPTNWAPPSTAPSSALGACQDLATNTIPPNPGTENPTAAEWNMIQTICLAQAIDVAAGGAVVTGVIYDTQSLVYNFNDSGDVDWLKAEANKSNLKLGWISPGFQPVDLSVLEIYDLYKDPLVNGQGILSVDTVAPESIYKLGNVQFPGPQKEISGQTGEVSANIYQCAIAGSNSERLAAGCGTDYGFVNPMNLALTPDTQMENNFDYLYGGKVTSSAVFGTNLPTSPTTVLFLFSTQYLGPIGSYDGEGLECTQVDPVQHPERLCHCVASNYYSTSPCSGGENGFGSWFPADGVSYSPQFPTYFNNVAQHFVTEACPPGITCQAGIYMYQYIPQAWLKTPLTPPDPSN